MRTPVEYIDTMTPKPTVLILDMWMRNPVQVTRILDLQFEDIMNDTGGLTLTVPATQTMAAITADVHPDAALPVIVQLPGYETVWFATHVHESYGTADGDYITISCVSPHKHLEHLFAWIHPELPPEAQLEKSQIVTGPVSRIVKEHILRPNFRRMSLRIGELFDGQIGRHAHFVVNGRMEDNYSRMTIISIKFDQSLETIRKLLEVEGLTLACGVYLPGRGQTPPVRGVSDQEPYIWWDVEIRSELPEGWTLLDSIGTNIRRFWSDVWDTISGYDTYDPAEQRYWTEPKLMLRKADIKELEVTTTKPTASTFTVGGKTAEWLNNGINLALKALLEFVVMGLGLFLDLTGLDDVLDDRFFSYHSYDDWGRRKRMGPFGFFEEFRPSTGMSLDALFQVRAAQWESRSVRTYDATLEPKVALVPGKVLKIGTMTALELPRGGAAVAFATKIKYEYADGREADGRFEVQISDRPQRDPVQAMHRRVSGLASYVNQVALAD